MLDQPALFHESWSEALLALVTALGGKKVVAALLYPEKPAEEGARYLADCLNDDRPHALNPDKLKLLLKIARERGIHLGMHWLCDDLGYTRPSPVDPEDQQSELMRQFIRAVDTAKSLGDRLARLNIVVTDSREARR